MFQALPVSLKQHVKIQLIVTETVSTMLVITALLFQTHFRGISMEMGWVTGLFNLARIVGDRSV